MPSLADLAAINASAAKAFFAATCADPTGPCPGCASQPNPDLFAYCDLTAQQCVGADLATHPANTCQSAADCTLRIGLECCECGSQGGLVAVPKNYEPIAALVCEGIVGCPECLPVYPTGVAADCVNDKCVLTYFDGGG